MTELTDDQVKALLDGVTPRFLIRKHGGYYRPNCQGYTSSAILAGRYTEAKAISETHPNGPNGPRDGMTYTSEDAITDEDFAAYIALREQRDDLARALLDARAELARVKADAAAAMALVVERAAENKEQLDIWAQEILEGLSFADVLKITSYDDKIEAHNIVGRGLVDVIRTLAPADALAEVQRLRVEARENAMQALASMGQAQEAYEAQLEAEAELAAAQQREAVACRDGWRFAYQQCLATGSVPDPDYKGGATLTPTDPGDGWTWNERLGWIGPDGKPADPRRRG